jgi:putative ABC transport system ATP-binding protein
VTLEVVGLTRFAHHRPSQLSGGQRQRVAIARALATGPKIVLADEPTANLDHKTGEGILALMKEINRKLRTTFIFSTHDQKVLDFADHYVGMEDGELRFLGLRKDDQWVISDDRRRGERRVGERRKAVRVTAAGDMPGVRPHEH